MARKRITIPLVDATVHEWWALQHNPSESIRHLIRSDVARNGLIDSAYGPVAQQPRRGRPPGIGEAETNEVIEPTDDERRPEPTPAPSQPEPVRVAAPRAPSSSAMDDPISALING